MQYLRSAVLLFLFAAISGCSLDSGGARPETSAGSTASSATAGGSEQTGPGGAGAAPTSSASSGPGGGATAASASSTGGATSSSAGGAGGAPPDPVCGDGKPEGDEQCDDGGTTAGDGCGATCQTEHPDVCPGTPIPISSGTLVISGDTTGADDTMQDSDGTGTCTTNPSSGPDFIYAVEPTEDGTLTATLDAGFAYHWLRARLGCPSGQELDCDYSSYESTDDVISFAVTAGETYWVIVDSWAATAGGSFVLTLQL